MSQGRRNPKIKRSREKLSVELEHVVGFLRFIAAMSGTLLLLSILFFLLSEKTSEVTVVYTMTILVNLIAFAGSMIGAWWFAEKDRKQQEQENERLQHNC